MDNAVSFTDSTCPLDSDIFLWIALSSVWATRPEEQVLNMKDLKFAEHKPITNHRKITSILLKLFEQKIETCWKIILQATYQGTAYNSLPYVV